MSRSWTEVGALSLRWTVLINVLIPEFHIFVMEISILGRSVANEVTPKVAEGSGVAMTFTAGPWEEKFGHLLHMPGHIFIR